MEGGEICVYDKAAHLSEMLRIDYGLFAFCSQVSSRQGAEPFDIEGVVNELVEKKRHGGL